MRQARTSVRATPKASGTRWAGLLLGTAALVTATLLAGCSGGDDPSRAASSTTTPPAATTSTQPVTPTTTPPAPTTSTATPTSTPKPTKTRWPKALGEPQQGDSAWAVYLAVAHSSSDPALEDAQGQAANVGYGAVIGDLACDRGSMKALDLDQHDYWVGAVLYFKSRTDAEDFANSYLVSGGTVVGVAKIGLGCLD
jgi:hypothetical protein